MDEGTRDPAPQDAGPGRPEPGRTPPRRRPSGRDLTQVMPEVGAARVSILVVDDHAPNLVALEAILDAPSQRIVRASSGEDAFRCMLAEDFAVILMDVRMPGIDGFTTASIIRTRDRNRHIPIIFLTASTSDAELLRGYEYGAVDFMVKPFEPQILRSKVAVFVELFRQREQIREQQARLHAAELEAREKESDLRWRRLVDAMPVPVWCTRPDGELLYANERWLELTGLAGGRAPFWDAIHKSDLPMLREAWTSARATGSAFGAEFRILRAWDGAAVWHLGRVVPDYDAQGGLIGWIATAIDIDEQKRTQRERQALLLGEQAARADADAQRRRLNDLFMRAPAIIAVLRGDDLCVELMNPPARAAFGHENVVGTPARALLPQDIDQQAIHLVEHVYRSGETIEREAFVIELATPEGGVEARSFNLACLATHAGDGKIDGVMIHAVDVTREVSAVRARDEFLSIAGHELRTPLTSLQLTVQGLLRQAKRSPEQPSSKLIPKLTLAEQLVRRQGRLIEDLLDVSRITEGRLALDLEEVELVALVQEIIARCQEQASAAGCPIELQSGGSVTGSWDRARVEQVVMNLLVNAMKYGRGAPIELRVEADAARARIFVVDHGIGIDAADHERIFERFYRASTGPHSGGFGLGLWITRQIVRALNGSLEVRSAPGEGATFTVELPISAAR